jgi:hypothetical protein
MAQSWRRLTTLVLVILVLLDVAGLILWTFRPPGTDNIWPGLSEKAFETSPFERTCEWAKGREAPLTPTGLLTQFRRDEILIAVALVAALSVFVTLLVRRWVVRLDSRLTASVLAPRVKLRVGTALVVIAAIAAILGWEVESWKNWRRFQLYERQWESYTRQERSLRASLVQSTMMLDTVERALAGDPAWKGHFVTLGPRGVGGLVGELYHRYFYRRAVAGATARLPFLVRMRRKYQEGMAHPWRTVEPDAPPEGRSRPDPNQLLWSDNYSGALRGYSDILGDDPDNAWALDGQAWIWATCPVAELRDGARAVDSARRAHKLAGDHDPFTLDTLAAALAESGDFRAAAETERTALRCLPPRATDVPDYQKRLALYESGKPFRARPSRR